MDKNFLREIEKIEFFLRPAQETIGDSIRTEEDLDLMKKRKPKEFKRYQEVVESVAKKIDKFKNEGKISPHRIALLSALNTEETRVLGKKWEREAEEK